MQYAYANTICVYVIQTSSEKRISQWRACISFYAIGRVSFYPPPSAWNEWTDRQIDTYWRQIDRQIQAMGVDAAHTHICTNSHEHTQFFVSFPVSYPYLGNYLIVPYIVFFSLNLIFIYVYLKFRFYRKRGFLVPPRPSPPIGSILQKIGKNQEKQETYREGRQIPK